MIFLNIVQAFPLILHGILQQDGESYAKIFINTDKDFKLSLDYNTTLDNPYEWSTICDYPTSDSNILVLLPTTLQNDYFYAFKISTTDDVRYSQPFQKLNNQFILCDSVTRENISKMEKYTINKNKNNGSIVNYIRPHSNYPYWIGGMCILVVLCILVYAYSTRVDDRLID